MVRLVVRLQSGMQRINDGDAASAAEDSNSAKPSVKLRESSRSRFEAYRERAKSGVLPRGSVHSKSETRSAKDRIRTTKELLQRFFQLLRPFQGQIVWILTSLTISTLLALIPPAGTKFLLDYVLSGEPVPDSITGRFPKLADPKWLLLATVLVVVTVSLLKIAVHITGRWYATRITKHIQLHVRRNVFEHAV